MQISRMLVEMQIENNKVKEASEAEKYDLTNKVRTPQELILQ